VAIGPPQERLESVSPEIRADGDRVRAQAVEHRAGVRLGGVPDVAPLGVEQHGDVARDGGDELAQQLESRAEVGFEEGDVRLVAADEVGRRFDDAVQEGAGVGAWGQSGRVGVEADAEHRVMAAGGRLEALAKAGGRGHVTGCSPQARFRRDAVSTAPVDIGCTVCW
jgi:hypothetical protein